MNKTTSALLANITDMQSRLLEMQQQLASQLQREKGGRDRDSHSTHRVPRGRVPYSYDRGGYVEPSPSTPAANTSIRLQHAHSVNIPAHAGRVSRPPRVSEDSDLPLPRAPRPHGRVQGRSRPKPQEEKKEVRYETVPLSSVLQNDEEVTLRVIVKKDEEGQPVYTTTTTRFDGSVLTVVASDLVPQMVGVQSSKPGEILYQFIDALKESGHLKRSFTIAPWKLCTVVRDGQTQTLEELRRVYLASDAQATSHSSSE